MHPRRTQSAPPARARVNFYEFLLGGLDFEVYLDGATTKKRSSTFLAKKCTPADKVLAMPMYTSSVQLVNGGITRVGVTRCSN